MKHSGHLVLTKYWYQPRLYPLLCLLLPFSFIFRIIVLLRNLFYRIGILKKTHFNVPVIVVGNITVGGTGKTPFVIWLAEQLKKQGFEPGIVSRGVGKHQHVAPHLVQPTDTADYVGDEAKLLSTRANCPLVVCVNRVAAVQHLLKYTACNVVISDDGLQHHALGRALEIVIVDGNRLFGNKHLLPAGPLREPLTRLRRVNYIVVNGGNLTATLTMQLSGDRLVSITTPTQEKSLNTLEGQTVHAVAAIGNPERFFASLRQAGLKVISHVFPDHHAYQASDLAFNDTHPVLMTEKDAVKCVAFASERFWYLPVNVNVNDALQEVITSITETLHAPNAKLCHAHCCPAK